MARDAALSFDIQSDISNFSRAMQVVENTAKQKAASFALEFTGAGKKVDDALGGVGKRAGVQIGDALSGAAKRFEGEFSKAAANVNTNLTKSISSAVKPVQFSVAGVLVGVAAIAVAYATVTAAIGQANAQIERFIKLGDNAERAGIGVEFFQRFSEAAEDAKLSVDEIEKALKRAGSAVMPKFDQEDSIKKRLNEVFESGYTGAYDSKGLAAYNSANTNEQRIRAAVTAMQELRDVVGMTAAVDLAEKLFGAETAERIRTGRLEIEAIAAALDRKRDDLITAEQVAQATEFRERLDDAYKAIDDALHVSVALEGAGRAVLDVWLKIAETVADAAVKAGTFLDKMLAAAKVPLNVPQGADLQSPLGYRTRSEDQGSLGADLGAVAGTGARGRTLYPEPIGPQQPTMSITDPPAPPRRPLDYYTDPTSYGRGAVKERGGGSKAPATESLDQVETFINGIERSTVALKAEVDAIGKNAAERQSAINVARLEAVARQQGITLTDAQIAKVRELSTATAEYRDKIEEAREAQEAMRSIGGDVLKGIASDARSGASAMELLTNAVSRLAQRLGDKALDGLADSLFGRSSGSGGSGLLGGLLSGLGGGGSGTNFANALSTGGSNPIPSFTAGVTALGVIQGPGTGTSDSIVARVSNGESIVNARATARHRPLIEAMNADRLPGFASGRVGAADRSLGLAAAVQANQDTAAAQSSGSAAAPQIALTINEAPGGDKAGNVQTRQRPDGSMEMIVDMIERRHADRINRRRGPLAAAISNSTTPLRGT